MLLTQLPDFCQGLQAYQMGENMSFCSFPLNRFRLFVNPFDLLIPPIYSVPAMERKGVTHPHCLVLIRWGEAETVALPRRTNARVSSCHSPPPQHQGLEPHSVELLGKMGLDSRTSCICPLAQSEPGMHRNNTHIHTE